MKSIYRTVTTGLDDGLFSGPSMLDLIGQRLTRQAGDLALLAGLAIDSSGPANSRSSSSTAAAAPPTSSSLPAVPDLLDLPPELKPLEGETASSCEYLFQLRAIMSVLPLTL